MAAGTPYSSKNAKIRINNGTHYAMAWEASPETNPDDTTDFEAGGYATQVMCIHKCAFTMEGWFDGGANPFDFSYPLKAGQRLIGVLLYAYNTGGPYWSFPYADVLNVRFNARVDQKLNLTVSCTNWGAFAYPTGNIA